MAVTPLERGLSSWMPGWRSVATTARSSDVEQRLRTRRGRLRRLRQALVLTDLTLVVAVAGAVIAGGHVLPGILALVTGAAATTIGCTAADPRSLVAIRPVVRAALVVSGSACVLAAFVEDRPVGRDVLLGSALGASTLVLVRLLARLPGPSAWFETRGRRWLMVGDRQSLERAVARRGTSTRSPEEVLVVTRAARQETEPAPAEPATAMAGSSAAGPAGPPAAAAQLRLHDQRHRRDDGSGPTGLVERVVRTALDSGAERVTVLPGRSWQQQQLRELSWLLEGTGIDMVISTELDGIAPHRVDVTQQDGRLMIKVASASPRGVQALLKGALDRLVALLLLVLSAPLLALIAVAIRLESSGPAIFRQTRVREGGVPFTMYKFRTMRVDAERELDALQELNMHGAGKPLFKMADDPRVTGVGRLLRSTSLDELPQLVNVLKGQMSLIGPRPALPLEVEMYDFVARRRLAVKPGMTGLWQVSGRSRLSWDESLGFDLEYVDNWSPAADAAIALRTFRAVMTKDGAF
jgi:lipopolysaccharide/colanic/teichoic acid biosynthesis glycosyltransferase